MAQKVELCRILLYLVQFRHVYIYSQEETHPINGFIHTRTSMYFFFHEISKTFLAIMYLNTRLKYGLSYSTEIYFRNHITIVGLFHEFHIRWIYKKISKNLNKQNNVHENSSLYLFTHTALETFLMASEKILSTLCNFRVYLCYHLHIDK
jgi:hypothetical protein